jgi:hypothetical protein
MFIKFLLIMMFTILPMNRIRLHKNLAKLRV